MLNLFYFKTVLSFDFIFICMNLSGCPSFLFQHMESPPIFESFIFVAARGIFIFTGI